DIAWVRDRDSAVDTINGFVEVYLDARGVKGAWEGLVYYVNAEKTRRIEALAQHAQWFEDQMPWDPRFRKPDVQGVTVKAIDVIGHGSGRMAGDAAAPPQLLLKEQYSALEESRADLVALYFLPDRRLVELGIVAAEDHDGIVRAEYEYYARNALTQLRRVREG